LRLRDRPAHRGGAPDELPQRPRRPPRCPGSSRSREAFGSEFIVNGKGPEGLAPADGAAAGCPTIILEGGEVWKVEPAIVEYAVRGVRNVLAALGLVDGTPETPAYQIAVRRTKWVRADCGGFLRFHVAPGELVAKGDALATNTSLLGQEEEVMVAPFDAAVLGMTTLPAVRPGEPVCHLGRLEKGEALDGLATSVMVEEPEHGDGASGGKE
jgi:predicted deacylase